MTETTRLKTVKTRTAIIAVIVSAAAIAVLFIFNPTQVNFYPPCIFHSLTGLYCPGCGTARALHQLLHGNIRAALSYNLLTMASLPILLALGIRSMAARIGNTPYKPVFKSAFWPWLIVAILVAFGILRNIPVHPFNLLAPH